MYCWRLSRNRDLVKPVIILAPESGSPFFIQTFHGVILLLQPFLKCFSAAVTHTKILMAVTKFVINLPANDIRMVFKSFCHCSNKSPDVLPVCFITLAIMMTSSKAHSLPI